MAQEYLSGETLHGLAKRHDLSRNLVRVWVQKYEIGALDEDAAAAEPTSPHRLAPKPRVEVYLAAAENDGSYPLKMAEQPEAALSEAGVQYV